MDYWNKWRNVGATAIQAHNFEYLDVKYFPNPVKHHFANKHDHVDATCFTVVKTGIMAFI